MTLRPMCIIVLTTMHLSAQILDKPKFSYERLFWGMKISQMAVQCKGKDPKYVVIDDRNPFAKASKDIITYSYSEYVESEKIGISMMFDVADSTLNGLAVIYIGVDSVKHELLPDVEQRQERLVKSLTSHFPGTPSEKSIPFMGTVLSWKHSRGTVTAINTTKSLMIIYKQPQ